MIAPTLINRTISTVVRNLIEGALLVTVILFLFLGDLRASLICAIVIPLSMLVAFIGMNLMGVSGNLMSLGAIDFGLIVDGSVVMVENIFRRLAQNPESRRSMSAQIFDAGREVLRPIVFAIGIIIIVYLPILTFENVEGKMFRPMAYTVIFALAGSLLCALTLVPVLASLLIKRVSASGIRGWRGCAIAGTPRSPDGSRPIPAPRLESPRWCWWAALRWRPFWAARSSRRWTREPSTST